MRPRRKTTPRSHSFSTLMEFQIQIRPKNNATRRPYIEKLETSIFPPHHPFGPGVTTLVLCAKCSSFGKRGMLRRDDVQRQAFKTRHSHMRSLRNCLGGHRAPKRSIEPHHPYEHFPFGGLSERAG